MLLEYDKLLYATIMFQVRANLSLYFMSINVTVLVFVDVFVKSQLDPKITKKKFGKLKLLIISTSQTGNINYTKVEI